MWTDKHYHFWAGVALSFIVSFLASSAEMPPYIIVLATWIVPLLAGFGKEIVDHFDPYNKFDWGELVATMLGASILGIPTTLIYLFA